MPTDQKTKLEQSAAVFYADKELLGCTKSTLVWYRDYIGRLVRWLMAHGVTDPRGITLDLLRLYVADVQKRGLAPKTVHHHVAATKVFCKWLYAEGLTDGNAAERLPRPKVPKKVLPALSQEDVRKLLQACDCERDKALLLFMLDTGARCAETIGVNVGDVDTRTGAVTITQGKGQKGRMVYLGAQSRRALLRFLLDRGATSEREPLWTSQRNGERLTTWGVTLMLRRLGERTGVHVHPHMLRRTMAVMSLRAGMDIVRLAALLGHSDLATVRRYLALVGDDLRDAHREHGPVDTLLKGKR